MNPLAIGSGAVGILGQVLAGIDANKREAAAIKAGNRVTRKELHRQEGYQGQASDAFSSMLGEFAPDAVAGRLGTAQTGASDYLTAANPTAEQIGGVTNRFAQPQANTEQAKSLADVIGRQTGYAQNQGKLMGYGLADSGLGRNLADKGQTINMIGDFARGSASLTPLERTVAQNNAMGQASSLPDILNFLSQIGGYKAGGGTLFGRPATAAPVDPWAGMRT